ncbi:hypothetical protein RU639_000782 [Aspergillus parasiticus]
MMAPVTSLDTLVRPFANFIIDSLEAAPFLSFVILVLIYIFLAPTVIAWVFRLCGLASATDNESQRTCPTLKFFTVCSKWSAKKVRSQDIHHC